MNPTPDPNPANMPQGFFRRLFSWRVLRRVLFGLACLATLVALLVTVENWRGKQAWEKFKREWEAKGERFDLASVIPPPVVPDDQNFALAPIFAGVFNLKADPKTDELKPRDPHITDRLQVSIFGEPSKIGQAPGIEAPNMGSWQKAVKTDLKLWQQYYRDLAAVRTGADRREQNQSAQRTNEFPVPSQPRTPAADVLFALSKYDSVIEELRQAGERASSRFPLDYEDGFGAAAGLLPPMQKLRNCGQFLRLHAVAELASGQSEKALADSMLSLRLVEALRGEPLLISHMVRVALFQLSLEPVWEGLADHQWSDAQLVTLERELGKLDFLADYQRAMRGERAFAVWYFDAMRHTHKTPDGGWVALPNGWIYRNQIATCQMHLRWTLPMVDAGRHVVSPEVVRRLQADFKASHRRITPYDCFTAMVYPAISKAQLQFVRAQSAVDLARGACALERYRLAHGQYPETLDALIHRFIEKLPHDIIGGQPLKYHRIGDAQFVLYSIGWNETDDGGTVNLNKNGAVDWEKGDWVWRYP